MLVILGSAFVRPDEQKKEASPHFEFHIKLSELPNKMRRCRSTMGVYADQIEFGLVDMNTALRDEPYALVVDLYCSGVNSGYRNATGALFGFEIGAILALTSDVYATAMTTLYESSIPGDPDYIGELGVVEHLLEARTNDALAAQVFHRLMANSLLL